MIEKYIDPTKPWQLSFYDDLSDLIKKYYPTASIAEMVSMIEFKKIDLIIEVKESLRK